MNLHRLPRRRRQHGLSLFETMIATAVMGTMFATGVPAVAKALNSAQLSSASSGLIASVQAARSEAVTRGQRVVIAARAPGDWASGWRMFVDANDNGVLDSGETLLRESAALDRQIRVESAFGATYRGDVLSFDPTGVARRPGGQGLVLGRIVLTSDGATQTLCFSSLAVRSTRAEKCERA
jgi:type IV fimbrial biogenesis protein FimT